MSLQFAVVSKAEIFQIVKPVDSDAIEAINALPADGAGLSFPVADKKSEKILRLRLNRAASDLRVNIDTRYQESAGTLLVWRSEILSDVVKTVKRPRKAKTLDSAALTAKYQDAAINGPALFAVDHKCNGGEIIGCVACIAS